MADILIYFLITWVVMMVVTLVVAERCLHKIGELKEQMSQLMVSVSKLQLITDETYKGTVDQNKAWLITKGYISFNRAEMEKLNKRLEKEENKKDDECAR